MVILTEGTKEFVHIPFVDKFQAITVLPAFQFVVENEDGTNKQAASAGVVAGMEARCLVDTTSWAKETYSIYLWFTVSPEVPRFGPFKFVVN